jgi:hypothetical protein
MSRVISTSAQTRCSESYAKRAADVREKAKVAKDNALREQLFDLARHYNFLADLAMADRDRS